MIRILCSKCNTHIADTDRERLDWPMTGEMFSVRYQGWFLRSGLLDLNVWCPACGSFPFSHDPYVAGANAVGKNLNVRGPGGKPVLMTVKQILMGGYRPMTPDVASPVQPPFKPEVPLVSGECVVSNPEMKGGLVVPPHPNQEWPCPECGAKKRFHRSNCSRKGMATKAPLDPHVLAMEARVKAGGPSAETDEIPPEEVAAMLAEREQRMSRDKPQPYLRPTGGLVVEK